MIIGLSMTGLSWIIAIFSDKNLRKYTVYWSIDHWSVFNNYNRY